MKSGQFVSLTAAELTRLPRPGAVGYVRGYYTGDFLGRCLAIDNDVASFVIEDTLRPEPKIRNRCSFPQCVREDYHAGEHEFARMRVGATIEVHWRNARFEPAPRRAAA
jgi:hypothetical protein